MQTTTTLVAARNGVANAVALAKVDLKFTVAVTNTRGEPQVPQVRVTGSLSPQQACKVIGYLAINEHECPSCGQKCPSCGQKPSAQMGCNHPFGCGLYDFLILNAAGPRLLNEGYEANKCDGAINSDLTVPIWPIGELFEGDQTRAFHPARL